MLLMDARFSSILLVEDDESDRDLFLWAIKEIQPGLNCRWAKDGQEALDILSSAKSNLPDCIYMDYNMPRMDGLECMKHIKEDPSLNHIPVVFLSTSSDLGVQKKVKAAGAAAYITKPFTLKSFVEVLTFYLVPANIAQLG